VGADFQTLLRKGSGPNCTKFGALENRAPSSFHQTFYFGVDMLIRFELRAAYRRVVSKIKAKFHTFAPPPCKN